ncbi:NAD(P)(+) transhydrogenase (Re/Si-specific) subunit beta [Candidatus Persebacteraceae bacterium Df01]|jgi:NAD(P) transhydrogenase subunit beta|uniref:NAD(P) transhydrogenase subunit beta n=1 Tax=Candidatus Doriopsillibacter californiensis TaxID=2970740 RepID=A0ABT7QN81_9GAMM|nr:NAD(P)(+) transhydrogenase (Re/Si-specific) subunit beta [Candidatus Persebacteraceae bacterium Df01]
MTAQGASFLYLLAGVCFIMSLRSLSSPETARRGNIIGMIGMAIAIITTLTIVATDADKFSLTGILITALAGGLVGALLAIRIQMTALPQLVAAFHSLVGLAAVLVASAAFFNPVAYGISSATGDIGTISLLEMGIGVIVGAITFTGSVVAFTKLQGIAGSSPTIFVGQHKFNALMACVLIALLIWFCITQSPTAFISLILLSLLLGVLLIIPIGGADMPVVVSMLNSYSGWAACGIGFTLGNIGLVITGALVGASGAILSYIMCKGMNRSIINVLLGGFGSDTATGSGNTSDGEARPVKTGSADDAAFIMRNAERIIVVPGYGMAVAQAQHALREMADLLKKEGISVSYAIHPVAGRMPGHMNVLLAEANVPYDEVFELEEINNDFARADVAFLIGANDTTNPAAKTDPSSPIYGMPILEVGNAKTVMVIKRSLGGGYAGVENDIFFRDNTMMLFGDAKKMCEQIIRAL